MSLPQHEFKTWANDPDACYMVCHCGQRGEIMSRNWNYDERAGIWEPQERHIPPCMHFREIREQHTNVPSRVRHVQTAYIPDGAPHNGRL